MARIPWQRRAREAGWAKCGIHHQKKGKSTRVRYRIKWHYIQYIHIERDRKRLRIPCQTWLENCAEIVRFWFRPGGSIDVMPLAELRKARSSAVRLGMVAGFRLIQWEVDQLTTTRTEKENHPIKMECKSLSKEGNFAMSQRKRCHKICRSALSATQNWCPNWTDRFWVSKTIETRAGLKQHHYSWLLGYVQIAKINMKISSNSISLRFRVVKTSYRELSQLIVKCINQWLICNYLTN